MNEAYNLEKVKKNLLKEQLLVLKLKRAKDGGMAVEKEVF